MKLSPRQREALEWLDKYGPWTAAWWSGRPHGRWPDAMDGRTYEALHRRGLVQSKAGTCSEKTVEITAPGRVAIQSDAPAVAQRGAV